MKKHHIIITLIALLLIGNIILSKSNNKQLDYLEKETQRLITQLEQDRSEIQAILKQFE